LNIIIIEPDQEYNNKLKHQLIDANLKALQALTVQGAMQYIIKIKDKLDLIILTIDISDNTVLDQLKEISRYTNAKIVLLSSQEDSSKRDSYFRYGVLDFHLKSNPIEHIVNDIVESMGRLDINDNETILVMDNSKMISGVVKYLLENKNYNVLLSSNAQDGIDIMQTKDISLLILDMELPDMHGINVLEKLRDLYLVNNFPILGMSSSHNPSIVRQALKKGASDFVRKPFLYEEFLLKIDLWIKSSRWQKTIKNQKSQIEDSLKGFKELVDSTMEALFIFKNNKCVDVNFESVKLLGLTSKDDILNRGIFEIFSNVSITHQKELMDEDVDHMFEDCIVNSSKDILNVQFKERNILIGNEVLKIIAVMDITSIKQKEKMLSHQTKMASMGEMIGNIAHQWRQPLTAISVAAGGIKLNYELDMVEEDEMLTELDNIVSNTQFLSSTIEDFQNFLKDDRSTTQFSVEQTVDKTIAIINANLESHEINVIKNYAQAIHMNGIQNDMIQVLLNIINNAADILKQQDENEYKKYIIIDASVDRNNLIITIQDSAGGVPDDIIGKIFEPYFTTKHQAQGTGLGLYMTHQIVVDNMGGTIDVENCDFSYEDEQFFGAKFTINIPI
jgi:signal transduction histidine kinase/DNA-binding response OmpR family regulator